MFKSTRIALTAVPFVVGLLACASAVAAKGSHHGGGGGNPPPVCTDAFPSFGYMKEGSRKSLGGFFLSSADGCRQEMLLEGSPDMRGQSLHMYNTAGGTGGVLIWSEEPGDNAHYVVRRLDFTVADDGSLSVGAPVDVLPRPGESVPPDEQLFYFWADVWGSDDSEPYLSVKRVHVASDGVDKIGDEWII